MLRTRYRVIAPGERVPAVEGLVEWPRPTLDALRALVMPILGGAEMEHVLVLADFSGNGELVARDMFVDEMGVLKGLAENPLATAIYRAAWLRHDPYCDPETLPWIAGAAVLFEQRVWS
jgi:hypothetical protein